MPEKATAALNRYPCADWQPAPRNSASCSDRLDPFRRRFDVEISRKSGDRAHDGRAVGVARHALYEGLVDLDLVDGKHLQIPHRRIANPEIIEDDRCAQVLELVQNSEIFLVLLDQDGLGDLELEARRRQPGYRAAPTAEYPGDRFA